MRAETQGLLCGKRATVKSLLGIAMRMLTLQTAVMLTADIAVIVGVAYLLVRSLHLREMRQKTLSPKKQLILLVAFGVLAVFGTYAGVEAGGAITNVRDLSPMIAGLIGGPVVGLGAGLIGGIHRYMLGGFTALPCSTATVLAGLFGGLIYHLNRGRFVGVFAAVAFAALMEAFHMGLLLLLAEPYSRALTLVSIISVPMILFNFLGMLIFALLFVRWERGNEAL
ncbi:MAG: LytS/YhcK type 5TM receptor domain-containing protein [Methermicoccaceae archaeon]